MAGYAQLVTNCLGRGAGRVVCGTGFDGGVGGSRAVYFGRGFFGWWVELALISVWVCRGGRGLCWGFLVAVTVTLGLGRVNGSYGECGVGRSSDCV